MEEHRIIQAAKLEENIIHTTPTPFVTQLPFTTPSFHPTPAPPSPHFSTPFHPTPAPPSTHFSTPIKPYPTPHSLNHFPKPTPIKPYPTPHHSLAHYPKPTPIKPYPTPIKPNSILPPYDTPASLPIRFPNGVHATPKPSTHFEPNHFIFPKERSLARPLPLSKSSRGFAHDFFSTPRKTSLVRGYYFEQ